MTHSTETLDRLYTYLVGVADKGDPTPSLQDVTRALKCGVSTASKYLSLLVDDGRIRIEYPNLPQRTIYVPATRRQTSPADARRGRPKHGFPPRIMTEGEFCAALSALGGYTDSFEAIRADRRGKLPPRPDGASGCGISEIYGCGGGMAR